MTIPVWDITFTIGGITFGATDANGVTWGIFPAGTTGWYDGPGVRLNEVLIPRYDGAYRANSYRAVRIVTVSGWVNAPSRLAAQNARDQLHGVLSGGITSTLTVVDGTQVRTMTVELGDAPKSMPHAYGIGFDFQVTFSATDPRKYGPAVTASTGLPAVAATGVSWGTPPGAGIGVSWGTPPGSGVGVSWGNYGPNGLATLPNAGTADAWPVFTLVGPVTSPTITDGAGNVLAWTGPALAASDTLVLTSSPFGPRSVLLRGTDNRASLTTAQWAPVPAGHSQNWQFQGTSAGSPSLTVSLSPAYW